MKIGLKRARKEFLHDLFRIEPCSILPCALKMRHIWWKKTYCQLCTIPGHNPFPFCFFVDKAFMYQICYNFEDNNSSMVIKLNITNFFPLPRTRDNIISNGSTMETRGKTNVEFRNEANETLGRHESNFDQLNGTLQTVLTELQSLRIAQNFLASSMGVNPFVQLASFHLKGIALQWHRWFTKFKGPVTWEKFTKAVLQRFGLTDYEDPSEVKQPRSLANAIGIARLIEERNSIVIAPRTAPNATVGVLGPPPSQKSVPGSPQLLITFKRITGQEARERHQKGLCYYCDEKYVAGHRCKRPQLFMMEDFSPRDENNIVDDLSQ
ncbi:hypothetical protein ACOSQ2_007951 [Xanthoceras sorbifolium]